MNDGEGEIANEVDLALIYILGTGVPCDWCGSDEHETKFFPARKRFVCTVCQKQAAQLGGAFAL